MSLFADILDVHTEWLTQKGYDARSLGLMRSQDDPLNRLEDRFKEIVSLNFWARKPLEFHLLVTGQFGRHGKDTLQFHFHYRYDPNRIKLNLLSLAAELDGNRQTWLITGDRRHLLPTSQTVFEALKKQPTELRQGQLVPDPADPPKKSLHY